MLEAKLARCAHAGCHGPVQSVEDLLEQLPRTMRVGVGKRGARRCLDAQVSKLALAALQPALNLAQAMGPTELTEQHGDELAPTGKPFRSMLGTGLPDHALKLNTWNQLEDLAEHAA